ncbi:MAG TPA: amidohydrolase, partial [Rhodospirillales bacterium]|nr:amidohydrolase [Rhodospirillales bacterium]
MPVLNRVAEYGEELVAWRRDLHAHPELAYEEHRTAAFVAEKLRAFGVDEVHTGIGGTGVVGVLRAGRSERSIALRADMDALPIAEETGLPWASRNRGTMHACGHDGHTTMLLGAARYLAETRRFDGTVYLIFQPAEEGLAGAKAMLDDGLLDRFPAERVFGMHNWPWLEPGRFAVHEGPVMAASDEFRIRLVGRGCHAAMPHLGRDPIVAGAALVQALQTLVSREADPLEALVVSVTCFNAGDAYNVIPETADLVGTVRCFRPELRDRTEERLEAVTAAIAEAHGISAEVTYRRGYPATTNAREEAWLCAEVAAEIAGAERVVRDPPPSMGAEDFAFMLERRPGAYV